MSSLNISLNKTNNSFKYDYLKPKVFSEQIFKGYFKIKSRPFAIMANVVLFFCLTTLGVLLCLLFGLNSAKTYGNHCKKDYDCGTNMNLICENGFCNCTSTSYYKSASYACGNLSAYLFLMLDKFYFHFLNQVAKKTHLESCTNNTECCCGQYCYHYYSNNENTTRCQCSGDRWWNDAIPYCQKRSTYGEYCASTSECYYYSQNLICSNNLCTCSAPNVTFWNGTYCGKAKFNIKQKKRKQKINE